MTSRTCKDCGVEKPISEFPISAYGRGIQNREYRRRCCAPCYSARCLDRGRRNQYRLKKYGITLAEYNDLLKSQNNQCAICGKEHQEIPNRKGGQGRLHVDHDHATGKVRGLLCVFCNRMLGLARDNPIFLEAGAQYLRKSTTPGLAKVA